MNIDRTQVTLVVGLAVASVACSTATDETTTTTSSSSSTVWEVCPPQGAAPEGGPVTEDTYAGQPCAAGLHCEFIYGDCPDLTGYGPWCQCVDGAFACVYHSCGGVGGSGGGGGAGASGGAGGVGGAG